MFICYRAFTLKFDIPKLKFSSFVNQGVSFFPVKLNHEAMVKEDNKRKKCVELHFRKPYNYRIILFSPSIKELVGSLEPQDSATRQYKSLFVRKFHKTSVLLFFCFFGNKKEAIGNHF